MTDKQRIEQLEAEAEIRAAFNAILVKERDYERLLVKRLRRELEDAQAQLKNAVDSGEAVIKLKEMLTRLCNGCLQRGVHEQWPALGSLIRNLTNRAAEL